MTLNPSHPSLRCKAHWQNAQSQRYNQILPKSLPALPTPTLGGQDSAANLTEKLIENKKGQLVTRGIKHWGLGGYSNILPRIKFGVTGQESSPQSPTISYRHPLQASVKTDTTPK